ncbi:MAG TPA: DUF1259 domain-containing protein, partial [Desulfuromonadaceae bacterium]
MKRLVMLSVLLVCFVPSALAQPGNWQGVEKVFGRKGAVQGDMLKVAFPRSDLSVKIGEVTLEPGLALTSWIGFRKMGKEAMMMGDLVLLEEEVAPVMAKLVAEGIGITALHNHLIGTRPVVMFLHFSGEGNPERLSGAMRSALAVSGTPLGSPVPELSPAAPPDWSKVGAILGKKGAIKGNLFQVSFPRKEKVTEKGLAVPPYLGVGSSVNFQKVGDKAAATGDFVLIGSEVNPVIRALVGHGLTVTAVHSHMLFESPRLFYLHFWGYDEPAR